MAQFVNDTFSGQSSGDLLENHVGETGATWTKHGSSGTGVTKFDGSGAVYSDVATGLHYASGTPANADQTANATLTILTAPGSVAAPSPCVRMSTSANTMYLAQYLASTGIRLFKIVAGTATQLGSSVAYTLVDGDVLTVSAIGTTIKATVNGVDKVTATDSAISAAGAVGIRGGNAFTPTTGYHVTAFTVSDTSSALVAAPYYYQMLAGMP